MRILDWIFPKLCLGCGKPGNYICEACAVGVWEEEQICPSCGGKSRYGVRHAWCKDTGLDGVVCMYAYDGIVKRGIEIMKYKRCFDVVGELIHDGEKLREREDLGKFLGYVRECRPIVVPVPLWPGRERDRGFNQAKVLVVGIGRSLQLETVDALRRIRDTGKQVGRSRTERLSAMKKAFAVNVTRWTNTSQPLSAVVVDDVWTTGTTLRTCGAELKRSGFKQVWGWVLAR